MSLPKPESSSEGRAKTRSASGVRQPTGSSADAIAGVEETVAKCQRGDDEGQKELFDAFHRRVYRLAFRMVGEGNALDLAQDVFLRVFQKISQFRGESRFETWLHRITVNECLQFLRRRGKRNEQPLLMELGSNPDPRFGQIEQRDLMERALERLETDLRSVFLLREVEGMNYQEIAEITQLAEGTVASRLNRARHRLRKILVELGWEP